MAAGATGASLASLVEKVGLNRTTTFRILRCLLAQGAIRYDSQAMRYLLGPLAFEIHVAGEHQRPDLRAMCAPAMERVAQATGDTVFLMLRSGDDSICVDRRLGSYPIKTLVAEIGTRRPLGVGAAGLAILSALPEDERIRVMRANARRLARYGLSPRALAAAIQNAHGAGFASAPVHGLNGVISVGVPIRDAVGKPSGAISVTAIADRMSRTRQRELMEILRAETAQLEMLLRDGSVIAGS
ncbi:MAG: IclR family transcriptional regulator [Betaproteobacteria bacterium]|nr:IclR family transcriptional regulator [Betaproteobacteria bacterium]